MLRGFDNVRGRGIELCHIDLDRHVLTCADRTHEGGEDRWRHALIGENQVRATVLTPALADLSASSCMEAALPDTA